MSEEISKWFSIFVNILMDFLAKEKEVKRTLWGSSLPMVVNILAQDWKRHSGWLSVCVAHPQRNICMNLEGEILSRVQGGGVDWVNDIHVLGVRTNNLNLKILLGRLIGWKHKNCSCYVKDSSRKQAYRQQ